MMALSNVVVSALPKTVELVNLTKTLLATWVHVKPGRNGANGHHAQAHVDGEKKLGLVIVY